MKTRALGNSDLSISEISFGCMSLPKTVEAAKPIIEAAINAGITYFDTADLYEQGLNEEIIGEILLPYRQQITLATKVGNTWEAGKDGWGWNSSKAYIEQAVQDSLKRLQTDVIDLYQLHGGTLDDNWPEVIETFENLKKQGYIRAYGISSIRPNVFVPFFEQSNACSNMMQYNLLDRRADEWFNQIEANGGSVVTRGSLAKGILTAQWQQRAQNYMSYSEPELQAVLAQLEAHYGSLHTLALAFNLQHSAIASTVIGASSVAQLQQTLKAYEDAAKIQDFDFAENLLKHDQYEAHR